jgi:hypothetical protein
MGQAGVEAKLREGTAEIVEELTESNKKELQDECITFHEYPEIQDEIVEDGDENTSV